MGPCGCSRPPKQGHTTRYACVRVAQCVVRSRVGHLHDLSARERIHISEKTGGRNPRASLWKIGDHRAARLESGRQRVAALVPHDIAARNGADPPGCGRLACRGDAKWVYTRRPSWQYASSLASGSVVSAVRAVSLWIFRDFLLDNSPRCAGNCRRR